VARARVNDGCSLDAVVTDHILLHGAPRKPDVAEGARTAVESAGRLQIKLRELAAVERQSLHFLLVDVRAHARRGRVESGLFPADYGYALRRSRGLHFDIQVQCLPDN